MRHGHSVAGNMGPGGRLIVALVFFWGVSSEEEVSNVDEGDVNEEVQTFRDYVKIGLYEESEQADSRLVSDGKVSVEDSIAVMIDIVNEADVDTQAPSNIGRSCGDRK